MVNGFGTCEPKTTTSLQQVARATQASEMWLGQLITSDR